MGFLRAAAALGLVLLLAGGKSGAQEAAPSPPPTPSPPPAAVPGYEETFRDLHRVLGERYGAFALKNMDWAAETADLLPRAAGVATDEEFGLLCLELVARLQDGHAALLPADRKVPDVPDQPRWDAGFVCLEDDRGLPVVYHVDAGSSAALAGMAPGLTVESINDEPAADLIARTDAWLKRWVGYSSPRARRYHAFRWFPRRVQKGEPLVVVARGTDGFEVGFQVAAEMDFRYQPRLPVPVAGVSDSADVSAARLPGGIGYLYVRRIENGLEADLDRAMRRLSGVRGLVIDVRGNSGGGFDGSTAYANFDCSGSGVPGRPRFCGPIAVLVDARCISAGEGWASWFRAKDRGRLFGETTAGSSSAKENYRLLNGHFEVRIPVRPRRGFLDRPIEWQGIEPDEVVKPTAADLAAGRDTVLLRAIEWTKSPAPQP